MRRYEHDLPLKRINSKDLKVNLNEAHGIAWDTLKNIENQEQS